MKKTPCDPRVVCLLVCPRCAPASAASQHRGLNCLPLALCEPVSAGSRAQEV